MWEWKMVFEKATEVDALTPILPSPPQKTPQPLLQPVDKSGPIPFPKYEMESAVLQVILLN